MKDASERLLADPNNVSGNNKEFPFIMFLWVRGEVEIRTS